MAWLCRACHSFVHGCAGNEELAREVSGVSSGITRDGVGGGSKEGGIVRVEVLYIWDLGSGLSCGEVLDFGGLC